MFYLSLKIEHVDSFQGSCLLEAVIHILVLTTSKETLGNIGLNQQTVHEVAVTRSILTSQHSKMLL